MKIKRIISSALTVVMLLMTVLAVVPLTMITSDAAYSPSSTVGKTELSSEEVEAYILEEYMAYNFSTAEEMLRYERDELGYLDSSTTADGMFTIYVNRYTGFLYYVNNFTGQILTSNPTDPGYLKNLSTNYELMSQIVVELYETSNQKTIYNYSSVEWASRYGQVSVSAIAGGLRVNYTIGDMATRFLIPARIAASEYTEQLLYPIATVLQEKFEEYFPNQYIEFIGNEKYDSTAEKGFAQFTGVSKYRTDVNNALSSVKDKPAEKLALQKILQNFVSVATRYTIYDPNDEFNTDVEIQENSEKFPLYAQGIAVAECNLNPDQFDLAAQRDFSEIIKKYCTDYTLTKMFEDEKENGYVHEAVNKPYVRCAIEYTFNDDGSLSVRVPANSISFDETRYTLEAITPLRYFGAGNMTDEGFIFFPDGSGTVVEFDDFYDVETGKRENISVKVDSIFGHDYCYASITGAHREQVTMPVYGLVGNIFTNETTKTALTLTGNEVKDVTQVGYFAILEEGATLAKLNFSSNISTHKYGNVYASYNPYPKDVYDLSQTLSVGSATSYTMVAKTKYSGSYVTRYTMLYDESIGNAFYGEGNYCKTSYVGMADYYRNYLKNNGTIGAFEAACEDLPLYIEVLGSMTITSKFLTFPVEEEIALTSFDDIITMYNELATARKNIRNLIAKCEEEMAVEEDEYVVREYESKIEKYNELLLVVENVKNINFRLTGFANDGMYYTYPTKADWQDVLGGKYAFSHLLSQSEKISNAEGQNLGIYPEFDFLYISNTAMFDGISQSEAGSRMVDNRYASKQVYNAILQQFETFYTMVVSTSEISAYYDEFNEDYSQYGSKGLSVSTLGSDLNSNFDKDNSINRDESRQNIIALLEKMKYADNYDLMLDKGNIYTVKYASHLLNVATDSSNFKYSSYTVPFIGMILHGHVNYAGTPLNYQGSVDYEILRAIESGAAPYYILCYQNTSHLKEDEMLNKYYGVDYNTWYDDILITYRELNSQIGALQNYEIVDHEMLIVERARENSEKLRDYALLEAEYFELLELDIRAAVNAAVDKLKEEGNIDGRVKLSLSAESIKGQFESIINNSSLELNEETFNDSYNKLAEKYLAKYPGDGVTLSNNVNVEVDGVENYTSQYSFDTKSDARADDEEYEFTKYTLDNNKVAIVTYKNGDDVVRFVLNFNIYEVNVRLDGIVYTLDKYEYIKLEG